jgi:uncharacterized protein YjiS (DUF1127 family)
MSTSTSAASLRAHGLSHWGQLNHVLGEWWQHLRSRHELESLDESMLRDIGLSRGEAGFEASKHICWTPAEDMGPDCVGAARRASIAIAAAVTADEVRTRNRSPAGGRISSGWRIPQQICNRPNCYIADTA